MLNIPVHSLVHVPFFCSGIVLCLQQTKETIPEVHHPEVVAVAARKGNTLHPLQKGGLDQESDTRQGQGVWSHCQTIYTPSLNSVYLFVFTGVLTDAMAVIYVHVVNVVIVEQIVMGGDSSSKVGGGKVLSTTDAPAAFNQQLSKLDSWHNFII